LLVLAKYIKSMKRE